MHFSKLYPHRAQYKSIPKQQRYFLSVRITYNINNMLENTSSQDQTILGIFFYVSINKHFNGAIKDWHVCKYPGVM